MSAEPIDYVAIQAEHDYPAWAPGGAGRCRKCDQTWPCDAYRCAEDAERLAGELWQHALSNGGCVPLPAYEECGTEVQRLAGKVAESEERNIKLAFLVSEKHAEIEGLTAQVASLCCDPSPFLPDSICVRAKGHPGLHVSSVMVETNARADQPEQVQP